MADQLTDKEIPGDVTDMRTAWWFPASDRIHRGKPRWFGQGIRRCKRPRVTFDADTGGWFEGPRHLQDRCLALRTGTTGGLLGRNGQGLGCQDR